MEIGKSLLETLIKLSLAFSKEDIKFCLVGGLALGMIARPRATEDIDVLVLLGEDQKKRVSETIHRNFDVILQHDEVMVIGKTKILRFLLQDPHLKEGIIIVDILFTENVIYSNAVKNSIKVTINSTQIPVVKPEDLILIKMLSNRDQDKIDIQTIIEENEDNIDEEYINTWKKFI